MKSKYNLFVISFAIIAVIFGTVSVSPIFSAAPSAKTGSTLRKIVIFQSSFVNETAKDKLIKRVKGVKIKNLDLINGMAVRLPSKAAEKALARQIGVLRIDDDVIVSTLAKGGKGGKPAPIQPAEVLPWGVDRIDADLVWDTTTGDPIKMAIIDTGIDQKHPDLIDNIKGGVNFVFKKGRVNPDMWDDDNGHGTHVAGVAAAADNEIGVIGVGPKIDLYAVKVLDRKGSGYLSDVIAGLDWAVANGMQVVNMSLGTSSNIQSFYDAVIRVNQAGIVQVAAAGNNGGSVNYPAAYSEVIAVSATDSTDTIASWSSRGPEVDLAAPGVDIYSTYKGQSYKTLSGTSMASPHVAGAVALVLTTQIGIYDLDGDGIWSPEEVQNKLEATSEDLGVAGKDNLYGSGLVDVERAVMQ